MRKLLPCAVFLLWLIASFPSRAQDSLNITMVGSHDTPGSAYSVLIADNYAYIADGDSGLRIIDISDPANPNEIGFFDTPGVAWDVAILGSYAYVADWTSGIRVIDISDPMSPDEVGNNNNANYAKDLEIYDVYAFIANEGGFDDLVVLFIDDPTFPVECGYCYLTGEARGLALSSPYDYAYVTNNANSLRVLDIYDLSNPIEIGFCDLPGDAYGVAASGNYVFVADGGSGLRIIDVSDPENPYEVGFYDTPGFAYGVAVSGNYAYVADGENGGLRVIEISDPTNPQEIGFYDTPGSAYGVTVSGDYVYVADTESGFEIFDCSAALNFLNVISPNGGESWRLNSSHAIQWISNSEESVSIELLLEGQVVQILADTTENDGVFQWDISDELETVEGYSIRISLLSGLNQDECDSAFTLTSSPTVSMTPVAPPIIIPDTGGSFQYWLEISNPSPFPGNGHFWTEVILPNGNTYGPLSVNTLTLQGWETYAPDEPFVQLVPGYSPSGTYQYVINIGVYPDNIMATDSFEFEKLPGANMATLPESAWSVEDWHNEAWEQLGVSESGGAQPLPTTYAVSPAWPNPFNPKTNVTISLPEAAKLSVAVYNVAGRQVAVLANGSYTAGRHTLTFDGSGMASGLYFIRATVPGELNEIRKMVLIR